VLDLTVTAFQALRDRFFDPQGKPVPFALRAKLNTQDDPFDEYLANDVLAKLPGIHCVKATGPLITPDMALFRSGIVEKGDYGQFENDLNHIVAIEVKKLERTAQGGVARASGLDFNTTPPCGRVRVYNQQEHPITIRGFYLFVCLEAASDGNILTALSLVDGDLLNTDYELYMSIVGEREKRIGLGSYRDGADRARPMLIFSNPLGVPELDHAVTLVHPSRSLADSDGALRQVHEIHRRTREGGTNCFFAYRDRRDVPPSNQTTILEDPFPTPEREAKTRPRGRFRLPF